MPYIRTVPPNEATGNLHDLYDKERKTSGRVSTGTQAMSLRPDVLEAWGNLLRAIRSNMDERRYELATVTAASRLRCSV